MPPKTRRVVCVEPTGRHSIRFAVHCFVSRRKHKTAAPRSAAELAKTAQRIADYRSKWDRMASVDVATLDDSSLALTTAVLDMNPDAYAAWNLRRRILSCLWAPKNDEEAVHQMAKADLKWIEKLVRSYPKSYWLWVHRGWLLDNMHPDPDWDRELILCQAMLDMDARNFHGWDYRRAILKKSGRTADASELEYTAAKIRQNFSNYSAWHYRGKLIARSAMADAERDAVVQKDFETVRNAIYTEPADQSAWLYQRWLLGEKEAPLSVEWAHLEATSDQEAILFVSFNHPVLIDDTQVSLSPSKTDLATPSLRAASHVYTRRISHLTRSPLTVTLPVSAFKLFPKPFPGQHLHIAFEAPSNQGRAAFTGSSKDPSATSETRMQPREVWTREMQSIRELVDVEPESKCESPPPCSLQSRQCT
ncbi:hypothetical protein BC830DRAFT_261376 [Chytriomyces sp. MP71]|nr:hypothetical protein BC830DRAFT_261376 [Chytriomyces sp. MP71]